MCCTVWFGPILTGFLSCTTHFKVGPNFIPVGCWLQGRVGRENQSSALKQLSDGQVNFGWPKSRSHTLRRVQTHFNLNLCQDGPWGQQGIFVTYSVSIEVMADHLTEWREHENHELDHEITYCSGVAFNNRQDFSKIIQSSSWDVYILPALTLLLVTFSYKVEQWENHL